jgi:hypothetical protein
MSKRSAVEISRESTTSSPHWDIHAGNQEGEAKSLEETT